jgi:hypothetical protein
LGGIDQSTLPGQTDSEKCLLAMPQKKRTQISATVKVNEAREGSTVIGVQVGLDEEKMRQVIRDEFTSLLSHPGRPLTKFRKGYDPIAGALFACEAKRKSTMGFAVNNSGLIICPSIVKPIWEQSSSNNWERRLRLLRPDNFLFRMLLGSSLP